MTAAFVEAKATLRSAADAIAASMATRSAAKSAATVITTAATVLLIPAALVPFMCKSYVVVKLFSLSLLHPQQVHSQTPFSRGKDNDHTLTWQSDVHVAAIGKSLVKGLLLWVPAKHHSGVSDNDDKLTPPHLSPLWQQRRR